jgi:hypothetical protein
MLIGYQGIAMSTNPEWRTIYRTGQFNINAEAGTQIIGSSDMWAAGPAYINGLCHPHPQSPPSYARGASSPCRTARRDDMNDP